MADLRKQPAHTLAGLDLTSSRAAWLLGVAVLVLLANVAASILYMVLYSHVINPGHEPQYYYDHIQVAGPYCSIAAGAPLMFLAGWRVSGWWQRTPGVTAALFVWLAYTVIDIAIILAAGGTAAVGTLVLLSCATKLAAAYAGARLRVAKPGDQGGAPSRAGI